MATQLDTAANKTGEYRRSQPCMAQAARLPLAGFSWFSSTSALALISPGLWTTSRHWTQLQTAEKQNFVFQQWFSWHLYRRVSLNFKVPFLSLKDGSYKLGSASPFLTQCLVQYNAVSVKPWLKIPVFGLNQYLPVKSRQHKCAGEVKNIGLNQSPPWTHTYRQGL